MTALPILPNVEAIIGKHLREHPDVAALGVNVAGETPKKTTKPWVRVTLLNAADSPASGIEWLINSWLQLDCYAGKQATDDFDGQAEAHLVKATCRAVLKAMEGRTIDGIVITEVQFVGDRRLPDTEMEPARERYILMVTVRAHVLVST